eukprot:COSAG04_NODE_32152_length_252_cov_1.836601_1_plen_59_part_01
MPPRPLLLAVRAAVAAALVLLPGATAAAPPPPIPVITATEFVPADGRAWAPPYLSNGFL